MVVLKTIHVQLSRYGQPLMYEATVGHGNVESPSLAKSPVLRSPPERESVSVLCTIQLFEDVYHA